jgi:hypothetical protein
MRAEIHGYIDEAEDLELNPGPSHQVQSAAVNAIAPEGVLQEVHFHARSSALCQGFGKRIRYFALFKEEILECYGALRGTYRLEQSRKNLIAIFQRRHFVAFQQGRAEQIAHHSDEDIVPDRIISDDFVMDLLLRGEEIANDNERRCPANGGCSDGGRPSRLAGTRSLHPRISDCGLYWLLGARRNLAIFVSLSAKRARRRRAEQKQRGRAKSGRSSLFAQACKQNVRELSIGDYQAKEALSLPYCPRLAGGTIPFIRRYSTICP